MQHRLSWMGFLFVVLTLAACKDTEANTQAKDGGGKTTAGRGGDDAGNSGEAGKDGGDPGTSHSDAGAKRDASTTSEDDAGSSSDAGGSLEIGAKGGALPSGDGRALLTVPPGVLDTGTTFTLVRVDDADTSKLASDVYDLGPDGSTFAGDVELCLTPKEGADTGQACLGYFDKKTKGWTCEDACVPIKNDGMICGKTNHFTNFALLLSGGSTKGDKCGGDYIFGSGGKITSPDGKAVLSIPEGALPPEGRRITVSEPTGPEGKLGSKVYEFFPDGLSFAKDSKLCIQPDSSTDTSTACLGYFDDADKKWKCEDTCLDRTKDGLLCGSTNHFTNFAILLSGGKSSDEPCGDKWLSTEGGVLTSPDTKATLTVPNDALDKPARITFSEPKLDASTFGSNIYALTPEGQTFSSPVELCLSKTTSVSTDTACLGYLNGEGKWVCEDECLTAKGETLCGETSHFTNFAILLTGGSCK